MLKNFLKGLLYFVGGVVLIGFFLPGASHVERSTEIAANSATIFNQINDLKNWEHWSPWFLSEPTMKMTYSQPTSGLGANYSWEGKVNGAGKMTTMDINPNQSMRQKLEFGGADPATVNWKLTEKEGKTNVVWTMDSDYGLNVIGRYFGLFTEKFVGPDYEKGLANLKKYCEANPLPVTVAPMVKDSAAIKK